MSEMAREDSERILNEVKRDQNSPNQRPKDAATLILIDRTSSEPQVLFGRRHASHKFLPGKFVFPGGRADPLDRRMPVARPLDPQVEARLMLRCKRPSATKARALALAAIRETAEETGLVLGRQQSDAITSPGGDWTIFTKAGVLPDLGDLHFVARAITPPRRPRRFDTRFFVADLTSVAHRIEDVVGPNTELVELVWMPIREATRLDIPAITQVVLKELQARTEAGFTHDLPVPFYQMIQGRFHRSAIE